MFVFKVHSNGCVRVEDIISKITDNTCLITVMAANNETGVIMPITDLGKQIHDINVERKKKQMREILFHTDAAQIIGKEQINFHDMNLNFLTIVGHKFYGPRIGCLVAKSTTQVYPVFVGGGQEKNMRPGTENTPMIVGLGIAAKLVSDNIKQYKATMLKCREKLESRLHEVFGDDIRINCEDSLRLPNTTNVSFKEMGLEGTLILSRCKHLIAGVGAACHSCLFSQVLVNSGVSPNMAKNSIRLSSGRNTSLRDVETIVQDLTNAVNKLKASL